jgi:hypothetical protein
MNLGNGRLTLQQLNQKNHDFWAKQTELTTKRMSHRIVLEFAVDEMNAEHALKPPFDSRRSLDQFINNFWNFKEALHKDFSQRGGQAPKTDALQVAINEIVSHDPAISVQKLLREFKAERWAALNIEIDTDNDVAAGEAKRIHFDDTDGNENSASLSGLKHRLYRAQKKHGSSR